MTSDLTELETWSPRSSVLMDDLPNNVWDVAVDRVQWTEIDAQTGEHIDRDEIYVYAAVSRVGIEVLRFDPTAPQGSRLEGVELIQTPGDPYSVTIRTDSHGDKSLIVSDGPAGLRVYNYAF